MRKLLSNFLVKLALKVNPKQLVDVFVETTTYEPKVCGRAYGIDKKYIKEIKKDKGIKSTREAKRFAVKKVLEQASNEVLGLIKEQIMQERIYEKGNKTIVEIRVNCYVPKEA